MQSHRRPAPSSEEAAIHLEVLASLWSGTELWLDTLVVPSAGVLPAQP
jgi:hypothetical protein